MKKRKRNKRSQFKTFSASASFKAKLRHAPAKKWNENLRNQEQMRQYLEAKELIETCEKER